MSHAVWRYVTRFTHWDQECQSLISVADRTLLLILAHHAADDGYGRLFPALDEFQRLYPRSPRHLRRTLERFRVLFTELSYPQDQPIYAGEYQFYVPDEVLPPSPLKSTRRALSVSLRLQIMQRDGWRCRQCGKQNADLVVDHVIPVSRGGSDHHENLQTLCRDCNGRKSNAPDPWSQTSGYVNGEYSRDIQS